MLLKDYVAKHKTNPVDTYFNFQEVKKELIEKDLIFLDEKTGNYDLSEEAETILYNKMNPNDKKTVEKTGSLSLYRYIPDYLFQHSEHLKDSETAKKIFNTFLKDKDPNTYLTPENIVEFLNASSYQSHTHTKKVLIEIFESLFGETFESYYLEKSVITDSGTKYKYLLIDDKPYIFKRTSKSISQKFSSLIKEVGIYQKLDRIVFYDSYGSTYYLEEGEKIISLSDFLHYYALKITPSNSLNAVKKIAEQEGIDMEKLQLSQEKEVKSPTEEKVKNSESYTKNVIDETLGEIKRDIHHCTYNKTKDIFSSDNINSIDFSKDDDNIKNRLTRIETYLERILDLLGG